MCVFIKVVGEEALIQDSRFYSSRQKVDAKVKEFCVSKENWRRLEMLKCIGNDVVGRSGLCCDTCNGRWYWVPSQI